MEILDIHQKLKKARKDAGLSQEQVAEKLKLLNIEKTQPQISMWEKSPSEVEEKIKGKSVKPSFDDLCALAEIYGVDIEYFSDNYKGAKPQKISLSSDNILIPKLNIFAGAGSEGVFDITLLGNDKNISVSREIIGALNPANLRAIEIIGDSMEPEFYEGDIAVVDMVNFRYNFVKIAGIYIVRTGEAIYIKKVDFLPRGGIKLISINKSYGDMELGADDDFEILGKVCGKIHFTKGLIFTDQGIS
ncbi:XRE family transcriptional regulator [Campylobacter sp. VBCF_06 NA8]|uniref:XRE family transcriptional regulator n=1 Tax=Campylobacter sp. VBCF_06 NA8 TaxID=2983822 RepID=UPI0022E9DA81|nr:XRE family transcriptional regulator [Campylobacter sp. VBCF_06 NA8]MDA3046726.1 XRE family transcriptional regulator [Campylobacter sp. VBCF_06 NA8]